MKMSAGSGPGTFPVIEEIKEKITMFEKSSIQHYCEDFAVNNSQISIRKR